jgi:hypothetical protein
MVFMLSLFRASAASAMASRKKGPGCTVKQPPHETIHDFPVPGNPGFGIYQP